MRELTQRERSLVGREIQTRGLEAVDIVAVEDFEPPNTIPGTSVVLLLDDGRGLFVMIVAGTVVHVQVMPA